MKGSNQISVFAQIYFVTVRPTEGIACFPSEQSIFFSF